MTDLKQLSHDAAKVLPKEFLDNTDWGFHLYPVSCPMGVLRFKQGAPYWLHKSTEACAEIYVRKLRGHTIKVSAIMDTLIAAGVEEMQAFRTAVLRALIEVKK